MIDISIQLLYDLSVISHDDRDELHSIYEAASQKLDLSGTDYCTIRDLVKLSGSNDTTLHLILLAMFISLNEGSVCLKISHDSLTKKLRPVLVDKTDASVKTVISNMKKYTELIHVRDADAPLLFKNRRDEYKPLILVQEGGSYYLYFQKYHAAEQRLKHFLRNIIGRKNPLVADTAAIQRLLHSVLIEKPVYINGKPAVLNDEQKVGITLPLGNNFVLISGGPGTGKTFIVLNLVRILVRLGVPVERIKIAAPTGRAARKLTEAIQRGIGSISDRDAPYDGLAMLQGTTIHRLLEYSPFRNDFSHNSYNKIRADVIIIDEASMIDLMLLGRLFEAVDERTSVVMLGDRNQLPSVEAGAVLAHLIPDDEHQQGMLSGRIVQLRECYRSVPVIRTIAQGINDQKKEAIAGIPELEPGREFPKEGVWRIDPDKSGAPFYRELHRILFSWTGHFFEEKKGSFRSLVAQVSTGEISEADKDASDSVKMILSYLDGTRILVPYRSGIAGTAGINNYIAGQIGPYLDPTGGGKIFSGAPIIITKNDYERHLFNGDVGVILKARNYRYYAVFQELDGIRTFPAESLPPFELAYAITVHKSQGSEYGSVLLIIPGGTPPGLLTKEILYTGITRAKKLVIIYSSASTLLQAIQTRVERQSGLILSD